ncbi:MAG: hypothetical protein WD403_06710 [Pirellulales bacterium]
MATLANFLKAVASLAVLGVVGVGGWAGYRVYSGRDAASQELREQLQKKDQELAAAAAQVQRLNETVSVQKREIERLDTALRLLKVENRVAYISVLDQWKPEGTQRVETRLAFIEVDKQGKPLGQPKEVTIEGDLVYVDAWVVKFDDKYVEEGDVFRATSLCLFRRLFGEYQRPSEGFQIDSPGSRPAAYADGQTISEWEEQIWRDFWIYANSKAAADEAGVRAAHGEAPSIKTEKGKSYKITLRSSGGLTIAPADDAPRIPPPPSS